MRRVGRAVLCYAVFSGCCGALMLAAGRPSRTSCLMSRDVVGVAGESFVPRTFVVVGFFRFFFFFFASFVRNRFLSLSVSACLVCLHIVLVDVRPAAVRPEGGGKLVSRRRNGSKGRRGERRRRHRCLYLYRRFFSPAPTPAGRCNGNVTKRPPDRVFKRIGEHACIGGCVHLCTTAFGTVERRPPKRGEGRLPASAAFNILLESCSKQPWLDEVMSGLSPIRLSWRRIFRHRAVSVLYLSYVCFRTALLFEAKVACAKRTGMLLLCMVCVFGKKRETDGGKAEDRRQVLRDLLRPFCVGYKLREMAAFSWPI